MLSDRSENIGKIEKSESTFGKAKYNRVIRVSDMKLSMKGGRRCLLSRFHT